MRFEKDAARTGVFNVLTGLAVLAVLSGLQIFFFDKPEAPKSLAVVVWLLGLLVSFIFLRQGVLLSRSGGKWEITIGSDGITWRSPNESVDKSFSYSLDELERTETRIRTHPSRKSTNHRYFLVLRSGDETKLSPNSGIRLDRVIAALEELGIENVVIEQPP